MMLRRTNASACGRVRPKKESAFGLLELKRGPRK
jgi:hypothetical protein